MLYKVYLPIIRSDNLCSLQKSLMIEINWGVKPAFFLAFIDLQVKTKTNWNTFVVTLNYVFPLLMI